MDLIKNPYKEIGCKLKEFVLALQEFHIAVSNLNKGFGVECKDKKILQKCHYKLSGCPPSPGDRAPAQKIIGEFGKKCHFKSHLQFLGGKF